MKRLLVLLCICGMLFSFVGCADTVKRFQYTYLDVFDTVTVLQLYATSQQVADDWAAQLHARLSALHNEFSIYDTIQGLQNVKAVNDAVGEAVTVSTDLMRMLQYGKQAYTLTDGKVNMAMGSVLCLWHQARNAEKPLPPSNAALSAANQHTDITNVVLDTAAGTVQLTDTAMSLDVGAFAKGLAAQWVAQYAVDLGVHSALISVGGNVVAVGDKQGKPFIIGIENPKNPQEHLLTVDVQNCAVVTSGDYQRYFEVDGVRYHHLIDPDSLQPAQYFASVSVIGPDSGMADILSTALFLMPQQEGAALLKTVEGYEAVWVEHTGDLVYSDGFTAFLHQGDTV